MINPIELSTDELYFGDKHYMSVSRYKKLKWCEVGGLSEFGESSIPMLVGSYVDRYIEGTLDKFILDNPQIISSRGVTKGELKSDFKQAEEICRYIDNDSVIQDFLSGEKQTVMTGEIEGVPFKIKMDSYSKGIAISDLKIMRTITDKQGEYYDFIGAWGYDLQLSLYQEIVFQNTGERLPVYIVAITKESPTNSAVIHIPQEILDSILYEVKEYIGRFYQIWHGEITPEGCGKCKSCISQRRVTPIISLDTLKGGL